ncbi:MAG: hypothetical protein WC670_04785 [Pseudolabrys sp.]|jgi:protein tyrosine phosphatase (PTP) superfamily phosphohydrolase (DUF442 family)
MAIQFNVQDFSLPCAGRVAKEVTSTSPVLRFFVTAQPVYTTSAGGVLENPYTAIARAGIESVVSVRDPGEAIYEPNPYDITEPGQLILNAVSFTNVPLPHFIPATPTPGAPQTDLTQAQFNLQAYDAAGALANWTPPALVHCSTGDRASAVFGVYLIVSCGYSNADALAFATGKLVLQNAAFKTFLKSFKKP